VKTNRRLRGFAVTGVSSLNHYDRRTRPPTFAVESPRTSARPRRSLPSSPQAKAGRTRRGFWFIRNLGVFGGLLGGYLAVPNQRVRATVLTVAVTLAAPNLMTGLTVLFAAGPPQAQAAAADAGVRDALQRYSAAFESLDVDAVKKVQPSVPTETLAKAFKDMRELKVAIDAVRVLSLDGTTARVSCKVTQTLTPKVGSKQTTAVTRVMRLKRSADVWVIDGFER